MIILDNLVYIYIIIIIIEIFNNMEEEAKKAEAILPNPSGNADNVKG